MVVLGEIVELRGAPVENVALLADFEIRLPTDADLGEQSIGLAVSAILCSPRHR